jgi:hypothetical protein
MAAARAIVLVGFGLAIGVGGCDQPTPEYNQVKVPPAFRTAADGTRIDNEDYVLDAQGYRLDKRGRRIGEVDIQEKTAGETSNAVAGYYISGLGSAAPGKIAAPSEGAGAGVGAGPGSANPMPSGPPQPLTR